MAKEVAISKRLKISEAQKYMVLSVLGASIMLGIAISLVMRFTDQIAYNAKVIGEADDSIKKYSNVIANTGACQKPKGDTYSGAELDKCTPDSVEAEEVPGSLRYSILKDLASNENLNSVPKENDSGCIDPDTGKNYTYSELSKIYSEANGSEQLNEASQLIKSCSALRVIPDALPVTRNEEALLASLNKLFKISNWEPESISPSEDVIDDIQEVDGTNPISVNLTVDADSGTTMTVLRNIERSIREFNIEKATIEWGGNSTLRLQAQATAYYTDKASIIETEKTVSGGQ